MPIRKNTQAKHNASKADAHNTIYEMVTMRILNEMSNGKIPWRDIIINKKGQKPAYTNFVTGKPYSFLNCLLLGEPGEFASFKQIKERGGGFSEGQAQRLSIARSLIRHSPILLLDEATSALDVKTESRVLKNIMQDEYPRTCIVTTHRPSVLTACKRVYAIRDKGCKVLSEEEIKDMMTG